MKDFLWKVYFIIIVMSLTGAAGIVPYSLSLAGAGTGGVPLSLLMLATFLQSFLISAVLGFFGLRLSLNTGLGLPVVENLLYRGRGRVINIRRHIIMPVVSGILCGLVMIIFDFVLMELFQLKAASDIAAPAWWKGILAALYGGMSEEIMLRLFAMNLIIFILNKIDRNKKSPKGKVVTGMIIASVIFGAAHLAAVFASGLASPGFIIRTLILNFVPGMVFGWLYWKRSFLSAVVAHFAADIVVHVAARFIIDGLMQAAY